MSRKLLLGIMTCLKEATQNTLKHDGIEHAGYLAFLGLLALFPFLVFLFSVIGVIGQGAAGVSFMNDVMGTLPPSLVEALQPRVVEIISGPPQGLLTVSVLGALWTASSGLEGFRTILNRAYHVEAPPAYWLRRSLSILQMLVFTMVIISVMLVAVGAELAFSPLNSWLVETMPQAVQEQLKNMLYLVLAGAVFVAVAGAYLLIPNIRQPIISVLPGAGLVVAGWGACAGGLSYYLSHFAQMDVIYGSLGSVIAALLFMYICNIVFIFGAEFNYVFGHHIGWRITKKPEAHETDGA